MKFAHEHKINIATKFGFYTAVAARLGKEYSNDLSVC